MLASFLGVKKRGPPAVAAPDEVAAWRARLGERADLHAGLGSAAILDFNALKERHQR
jgi:hypothetical protein